MKKVILKRGRERSVLNRHPWIFSGAIEAPKCEFSVGETVEVVSASGETLGYGSYSPNSQIRVRMLSFATGASADRRTTGKCPIPDAAYIEGLVASAIGRRADFFVRCETNAIRLINAESDGLPGVVADSYAGFIVCQFTSAGAEFWKDAIVAALMKFAPGCRGVSERTDLKDRVKEGLVSPSSASEATASDSPSEQRAGACAERTESAFRVLAGEEPPELIEIFEGASQPTVCKVWVDVRHGHKTGFYLDQRDARARVGALANGADVLNCFCYTGGFGLAAAVNGALSVTQVDVSADALALAKKNELLQHACGTKFAYEESDVFQYLRTCRDARKTFDLIVLDPPKFAETKSQVMKAARGYKDINLLAMKLLRPGGILATFSCSGAMTADLFDKILAEAAVDARRDFQVIGRTRQGADHPVALAFPEGWYLKGVILRSIA